MKLLSPSWWIGPPPGPVAAVVRRRARRRQRELLARFVKADREYRAHGLAPRIECPLCGHVGWSFYPFGARRVLQGEAGATSPHSGFHAVAAPGSRAGAGRPQDQSHWARFDAECPNCGSWERHRLMRLVLDELDAEKWEGPLLHFAPEPHLGQALQRLRGVDYQTADLYDPAANHQVDIQDLPFADASWSYLVCSHVLEHVPDDEKALAELRRVLKPGGILLLCVPCVPFYVATRLTIDHQPGDALRSLHGHFRTYGLDFVARVSPHFEVADRSAEKMPVAQVLRHGLLMWWIVSDLLLVCRRR